MSSTRLSSFSQKRYLYFVVSISSEIFTEKRRNHDFQFKISRCTALRLREGGKTAGVFYTARVNASPRPKGSLLGLLIRQESEESADVSVQSVGDDCPSGSFSSVSFEFCMAMPFAPGLPHLLLEQKLVSNIHARHKQIVIFHHVAIAVLKQVSAVDHRQFLFLEEMKGSDLIAKAETHRGQQGLGDSHSQHLCYHTKYQLKQQLYPSCPKLQLPSITHPS